MKKLLSVAFGACLSAFSFSQSHNYDVKLIPEEIKKNAHVVKRYENYYFEVKNISEATLKVDQVLTVMDERGKMDLLFNQYTNKLIGLDDAEVKVYDGAGKQIHRYKQKEMVTMANGGGLIEDGMVTYFPVTDGFYPITVQYSYTVKYKGTLMYPQYEIQVPDQGVEFSSFTAKVPNELGMRYRVKNVKLQPVVTEENGYKIYQWSVKNLSPVEDEPGAVSYESRYPSVILAPNQFKMDNYEGDMRSWKQFGLWYHQLKKGNDILSDERKAFYRQLVKDATTERERVKIIYNYLQKNFRYVSIQLGTIGGYRPLPAVFTDEKKYGDCKGLSNLMQSALDAVGIKSYQALINAEYNKEPVEADFPCNLFNHVILCVPQQKDSIWLECTSKTQDFAVLGNFTENRNALLITEAGGVLVATPKSKATDNRLSITTTVPLQENGSAIALSNIRSTGEYKARIVHMMEEKADDRKHFIVGRLGFKQPDYFEIAEKGNEDLNSINLELGIEKVPEFTAGSKMFLPMHVNKIWVSPLPKSETRKLDFYFECPFEKTDTTIFKLPATYGVDAMPEKKTLECEYGKYTTNYWFDEKENAVYSTVKLVLREQKIPAAKFAAVKKFFDDVILDEMQKIVIKKKS